MLTICEDIQTLSLDVSHELINVCSQLTRTRRLIKPPAPEDSSTRGQSRML